MKTMSDNRQSPVSWMLNRIRELEAENEALRDQTSICKGPNPQNVLFMDRICKLENTLRLSEEQAQCMLTAGLGYQTEIKRLKKELEYMTAANEAKAQRIQELMKRGEDDGR